MTTMEDLIAELRTINEHAKEADVIRGFLVSTDVWEHLLTLPVDDSRVPLALLPHIFSATGVTIRVAAMLPPNTIIPLDAQGIPLLKPKAKP